MSDTEGRAVEGPAMTPAPVPAPWEQPTYHEHGCTPLGTGEVARLLDVKEQTVRMWRLRGRMPDPDWKVGNRPLWCADTIAGWRDR